MSDLFSIPIERHSLSAFLLYNNLFFDFEQFIKEKTFKNPVHQTIYNCVKSAYLNNEQLDKVILAQKLKNLNINYFEENLDIFAYIETLYESHINEKGGREAIKELISLKVKRDLSTAAKEIHTEIKNSGDKPIIEVISAVDTIYANTINSITANTKQVQEVYGDIEDYIEGLGNTPIDEKEILMGPFPTINRLYGSLLRPSAITIIGARTGVGKTQYGFYYTNWVAEKFNIPIIHLDFSEMSIRELQIRAVSAFTNGIVPQWAVEDGSWRNNPAWVKLVRDIWPRVKKIKMYYYDIGGMTPKEIFSLLKRVYYQKIGRGNKVIVHYDYLKPFNVDARVAEYKEFGHFIGDIKSLMANEIPEMRLWASLQLNRTAVLNNRNSNEVDDSENAFSGSDRIAGQSTHSFILRTKLPDEIALENGQFGNMLTKCVKWRFLGKDALEHLRFVQMPDRRMKRNYVNLDNNSFFFEDKGDLKSIINSGVLTQQFNIQNNNSNTNDTSLD